MKSRTIGLILLGLSLAAAGLVCQGGRTLDLSDFQEFEFTHDAGLGFCPYLDFYAAKIVRQDDGGYTVQFSEIGQGDPGTDECLTWLSTSGGTWDDYIMDGETDGEAQDADSQDCPIIIELPAREMTDQQVQDMLELFGAVHLRGDYNPYMCIDYCLMNDFRWDDFSVNDVSTGCSNETVEIVDESSATALIEFLQNLRAAE